MECPKCGKKFYVVNQTRSTATLLGAGAGGYMAVAAGGKTGAVVGSLLCPGAGTVIGGLLGAITGAAAGGAAGNTIGRMLDENVMRLYRCESCNYQWRAA